MKMMLNFAIHKSLSCTAEEIYNSIEKCYEIPDVETSIYRDGWIIADPSDNIPEDWTRNKDDYRIEVLNVKSPEEDETIYDRVEIKDGYVYFIKD